MTSVMPSFVQPARDAPVEVVALRYGMLSDEAVHRLSVLPCRRVMAPAVVEYGVNDPHLGVCDRVSLCATCKRRSVDCAGHAGHIDLAAPVFHIGFFAAVLRICRTICKRCAHVLLTDDEVAYYTQRLCGSGGGKLDAQQRAALVKHIASEASKTRVCVHCGGVNGAVRRVRPMRIVHEKYRVDIRRGDGVAAAGDVVEALHAQLRTAAQRNRDLAHGADNVAYELLDPQRVRQLFAAIPHAQQPLLGLQPPHTHAVDLVLRSLLVPPVCVRPRGVSATLQLREDDLTMQYNDILMSSDALREGGGVSGGGGHGHGHGGGGGGGSSSDAARYAETWDALQMRVARLMDAAMPGFAAYLRSSDCKSYAQRLKGKHGRFRGNLNGKRVDFSGRSVISPDPNLGIDELAVPLRVARVLTYPQRVFAHNLDAMRRLVRNGPRVHPGAVTVLFGKEASRKPLSAHNAHDRAALAARLSIGDVVERHVMSGDLILFNRQPSLHRISMMAHRARVLPYRTFRFNECCCSPYNADFDGDEMNVHVVQTEEARAEAQELMLTAHNIITAKNGEPIIACTQDFLTAAYLLTARDTFFDRGQFALMVSHWLGATTHYALPAPAILRPVELWTGKQLFELVLRPSPAVAVQLNLEAKTRFYSGQGKQDDVADGFVCFVDSTFISGQLDKKLLGGGAKDGLFARLHALTGGLYTAKCMSRIAQLTSRYLQNYGFSLGLGDVAPTPALQARRAEVLQASFATCDRLIALAQSGRLTPLPGMTARQTLEAHLNGELSKVRDACGSAAIDHLDVRSNPLLVMLQSGSKGSALNTAQMISCVGQQTVNGKRIMNAFTHRSLPHFTRYAEEPAARGFVANSFFTGLTPTEFFFHTMAGREGLVDTAVKTAETGYIYRRLSKAMENLSVQYDGTVRSGSGAVVQLRYGEDGMDPWRMEGSNGSVLNLDQEWLAARAAYARHAAAAAAAATTRRDDAAAWVQWGVLSLLPDAVVDFVADCIDGKPAVLDECVRYEQLTRYDTQQQQQHETAEFAALLTRFARLRSRRFRSEVCTFFAHKVAQQRRLRSVLGLPLTHHATQGNNNSNNNHTIATAAADDDKGGSSGKATATTPRGRRGSTSRARAATAGGSKRSRSRSRSTPHRAAKVEPPHDDDEEQGKAVVDASSNANSNDDDDKDNILATEALQTELLPLCRAMLCRFLSLCAHKYLRKACEPGTPCGAIAAQSVGEPSTQMTLRTFHFAGVASMNITQGVPRLVEVINANKNIATPVITAPICLDCDGRSRTSSDGGSSSNNNNKSGDNDDTSTTKKAAVGVVARDVTGAQADTAIDSESAAVRLSVVPPRVLALRDAAARRYHTCRAVKGLLERVQLKAVTREMVEVVTAHSHYIQIVLNMALVDRLLLPIDAVVVRQRILAAATRPMSPLRQLRDDCVEVISRDALIVRPGVLTTTSAAASRSHASGGSAHLSLQQLLSQLPEVVVSGLAGVNRVMMTQHGAQLVAEGTELRAVMALPHVDGTRTVCNHVAVVERTLGIEAARQAVVNEINNVLKAYSLSIDMRHIYLLADVMTSRGVVLGITRYGIEKMSNNALTMASFERTTEHLYAAAVSQRTDSRLGVSESIIVGKPIPLGTNACELLLDRGSCTTTRTRSSVAAGKHKTAAAAALCSSDEVPPLRATATTTTLSPSRLWQRAYMHYSLYGDNAKATTTTTAAQSSSGAVEDAADVLLQHLCRRNSSNGSGSTKNDELLWRRPRPPLLASDTSFLLGLSSTCYM